METAYLLDWAQLLLRWAHVITAIAWIGASFYFVFLDTSLVAPADPALRAKGVGGELWAVHGGGFYNPQKYLVAPQTLPEKLHWFYWEAYSTWLTGFGLFTVLYLFNASVFLVDPAVHVWSAAAAVWAALGFLAGFWLVYDGLCRALLQRRHGETWLSVLLVLVVAGSTWGACQLFAGRAAFLLVGAMLATAMSANVAHWIIPGQRKVVAQLQAGQPVELLHGLRAKQRSVHNTYFTLPVLVAMLSNHYGWLSQGRYAWLALLGLMAGGALIRQFFVARHTAVKLGRRWPWGVLAAGLALLLAVIVACAPVPQAAQAGSTAAAMSIAEPTTVPNLAQVRPVIAQRCLPCHNAQVNQKGVALHSDALLRQHGLQILQQAVLLKQMPMGNATAMTDEERALLGRWVQGGML